MRIGLNISTASTSPTGVGNYALHLAKTLPSVAPDDEWVFLGADPKLALHLHLTRANARVVTTHGRGLARVPWEQIGLPISARRYRVDLLHGADFSHPIAYTGGTINTIHGISPFADEDFYPPLKRAYKRALITLALRRSAAIITVSEFTRRQILEQFSINEDKVFAIHHGVQPACTRCEPKSDPPFLLFVGTLENRKNLVPLVHAFRILKVEYGIPHHLILAGKPGYGSESIRSAIESSGVSGAIQLRGYVSQDELVDLYRSATILAFPAVWEDFGLPVIEAMSYGTPVVCARAAALPEVAGDAAEYFDPYSPENIANAIQRVLYSRERWLELHSKGLERVLRLTWEESARKHVEVYRQTLAR
jgi:glycosyltransferase involved in cell wall biosynthesis